MKITFTTRGQSRTLDATLAPDGVTIELDGERHSAQILAYAPPRLTFLLNNRIITAFIARHEKQSWIHLNGSTYVIERGERATRPTQSHSESGSNSGLITAPMPGQIRAILVENGVPVQEGQALLLLEAMKMEIRVNAPIAGQVTFKIAQGQSVEREQILATIQSKQ